MKRPVDTIQRRATREVMENINTLPVAFESKKDNIFFFLFGKIYSNFEEAWIESYEAKPDLTIKKRSFINWGKVFGNT